MTNNLNCYKEEESHILPTYSDKTLVSLGNISNKLAVNLVRDMISEDETGSINVQLEESIEENKYNVLSVNLKPELEEKERNENQDKYIDVQLYIGKTTL